MMDDTNIEKTILLATAILCVVFIGSLLTLIFICYQRRHMAKEVLEFGGSQGRRPPGENAYLVAVRNLGLPENLELDDVRLHPNIDQILADTEWVDDATGLIPHCLALLKGCHHLTERLVGATMSAMRRFDETEQQSKLNEISKIALTISPRVDDVVVAMYPPLDPRLLESRCLSLLLSVSRFAMVIMFTCSIRGQWIDDEIRGLEQQLKTLRDASQSILTELEIGNGKVNVEESSKVANVNKNLVEKGEVESQTNRAFQQE